MEYTICALASSIIVVGLDVLLKTHLLRQRRFWMFLLIMYAFMTLVNGYLTWRPIVLYGDEHIMGIRLLTIPIEDYVYGFGLMTASIVVWEWKQKKRGANLQADEIPQHPDRRISR